MRLYSLVSALVGALIGAAVSAYGSSLVIDNFTCPDSITQSGVGSTNDSIVCPGSLGGTRLDGIFLPGGSGSAVSTLSSNPPTGAITGTIGAGLSGEDIMIWSASTTKGVWNLPDLNLSGDSILIQIKSDTGGTLDVNLGSSSISSNNLLNYAAPFSASSSYEDVLIPLADPTIVGTGANVDSVTAIGLTIQVPGGGSWTMNEVEAVPEPSSIFLVGVCMLGFAAKSFWRSFVSRR